MDLSANFILTTGLTVTLLIIWNLLRQSNKAFHKILLALIFALFFLLMLCSYGEIRPCSTIDEVLNNQDPVMDSVLIMVTKH